MQRFANLAKAERKKHFSTQYIAADIAHCSPRCIAGTESGEYLPNPSIVASMGLAYGSIALLNCYCDICPVSEAIFELQRKNACALTQTPVN